MAATLLQICSIVCDRYTVFQLLSGYGFTKEYPVERLFRDAKVTIIYEGTNKIQRIVISKHLFERIKKHDILIITGASS